jgi:hypothetical protein
MLCKISGLYGSDYEEYLICYVVPYVPVKTEVSEENYASVIRVTKFDELGTTPAVIINRILAAKKY